ncbi:hypothetical protein DFH07DRAFT_1015372 [Mycena maculata]|uniref:Fungal-type protein kinase domain-containing protein n=1 Tax=Mycena maculata TaxID=230809 RepID=A0AAD7H9V2_9AGAR|nr:hypothetical protein DFH07DRAFT_1015372 [Mycena maculata]
MSAALIYDNAPSAAHSSPSPFRLPLMQRPRTRALAALEPETYKLDGVATYEERKGVDSAGRAISAISPYTPRSAASTEASASQTDSTPVKSGGATEPVGIDKLTRAHVEAHLAEELHARRSKSAYLVESLFGSLVSIDDAADILDHFLASSIISVRKETAGELKEVARKDHKAACAAAAIQANEAVTPSKPSLADPYTWKWGLPVEASEKASALFLNVVAIAAHAAAIRSGKAQDHPLPSLRFVTLPNPQQAVPLSNESAAQDCRPDVVAFDCSAFCEAPSGNASINHFFLDDSPFAYIREKLPTFLTFTAAERSACTAIVAFEEWFEVQERHAYLDMSRFCWPEVQLTVETKLSVLHNAMLQELVYMRQQRRSQPWMRSIVGLVITTRIIGVLRADTLGIEQCTFDRDCSRGVLDSIRICLGLVRATSLQRGQHEDFELADTKTLAPAHLKSKKGQDVFAPEASVVEYNHRTVRFIKLRRERIHYSPDGSKPDITFYVHHLVQDNGSLIGRCPRIFCVWRETESDGGVRRFVGPYALKVYYADHASDCFKDDLISAARRAQVKNVLLPTWEWYYGDALSMRGFPPEVVQRYTNTQAATLIPNVVSNREEVFAQSDLKRLLVQCSDYDEFDKAFADFTGAIASLAEQDLVHRDLSIGNVLLSQDTLCPSAFLSDAAASAGALLRVPVSFTQRPLEQRMGGLIHDMDMAGRLHRRPEQSSADDSTSADLLAMLLDTPGPPARAEQPVEQQKGFRTGTPPFMAIGLLVDGGPHLVASDPIICYGVIFLEPPFLSDIPFPQLVPTKSRTWPPDVLRWANRAAGYPFAELGFVKRGFFSKPQILRDIFQDTLGEEALWTADPKYLRLFWTLYGALWMAVPEKSEWIDRSNVTPADVEQALANHRRHSLLAAPHRTCAPAAPAPPPPRLANIYHVYESNPLSADSLHVHWVHGLTSLYWFVQQIVRCGAWDGARAEPAAGDTACERRGLFRTHHNTAQRGIPCASLMCTAHAALLPRLAARAAASIPTSHRPTACLRCCPHRPSAAPAHPPLRAPCQRICPRFPTPCRSAASASALLTAPLPRCCCGRRGQRGAAVEMAVAEVAGRQGAVAARNMAWAARSSGGAARSGEARMEAAAKSPAPALFAGVSDPLLSAWPRSALERCIPEAGACAPITRAALRALLPVLVVLRMQVLEQPEA